MFFFNTCCWSLSCVESNVNEQEADNIFSGVVLPFVHTPVFYIVWMLHIIGIHADFVFDMHRWDAGIWLQVFKDHTGPVGVIVYEIQCLNHQEVFGGDGLELVQVQTL